MKKTNLETTIVILCLKIIKMKNKIKNKRVVMSQIKKKAMMIKKSRMIIKKKIIRNRIKMLIIQILKRVKIKKKKKKI